MDKWNMVKLSDVFTLQMGKTPSRNNPDYWNGNHKWLSIADFGMNGKYINKTKECITDAAVAESGIKATPHNTVVMSFKLSIGKTAITVKDIFTNEAIMSFIDKGTYPIDVNYIYHLFSGKDWSKGTNKAVMGTTLNKATLSQITIPLPPIESQYQIADNLEKVSKLIDICNTILNKLDILVKSRFVEMFGDPVKNTKHIKTKRGIEIFKLSNGKAVPVEKRFDQGIPAYGGNGISWYTNEILAEQDTLVIGRVGFQSGNVHFARAPLWITDNAMYISSLDNKCYDIIFLCALMEHIDFTRYQDAGDLKKITQKPFMNTEFIAPPIEMQKKYVSFVEQTDKSKLAVKQILEKAETLKKSLMQEYFG